jgi:UTP--glucose-1-phosphate uridylyltransferase
MRVRRAVITAASPDQHMLPLQTLVDRSGTDKTALQLIVEEAVEAGVEEICIVIRSGDADAYRQAAGDHANVLEFVVQEHPHGYADALLKAKEFVADAPFLHLVGDHVYLSQTSRGCARQLVDAAVSEDCAVSAVQATRENKLPYFGAVGGKRVTGRRDLYEITRVVEKPTPTQAEQDLIVAGLRAGFYLCLFGMHVLTPGFMTILSEQVGGDSSDWQRRHGISPALSQLCNQERYLALQVRGTRHNVGVKYGLLMSQLALALSGKDRDQILTELIDLLSTRGEPVQG